MYTQEYMSWLIISTGINGVIHNHNQNNYWQGDRDECDRSAWAWQWLMGMEWNMISCNLKHGINHPEGCHTVCQLTKCYSRDLDQSLANVRDRWAWHGKWFHGLKHGISHPSGCHTVCPHTGSVAEYCLTHSRNLVLISESRNLSIWCGEPFRSKPKLPKCQMF